MKFSEKSTDILIENLCLTDYTIVTDNISKLESEIERLNKDLKDACIIDYINKGD